MDDFYTEMYTGPHVPEKIRGTPFGDQYEGCYMNYPDADMLRYGHWPELYYGTTGLYPFLQEVKRRYDPNNIFHSSMSVRVYNPIILIGSYGACLTSRTTWSRRTFLSTAGLVSASKLVPSLRSWSEKACASRSYLARRGLALFDRGFVCAVARLFRSGRQLAYACQYAMHGCHRSRCYTPAP